MTPTRTPPNNGMHPGQGVFGGIRRGITRCYLTSAPTRPGLGVASIRETPAIQMFAAAGDGRRWGYHYSMICYGINCYAGARVKGASSP